MTIVILGDSYYLRLESGFILLTTEEAMKLYDDGLITEEVDLHYD